MRSIFFCLYLTFLTLPNRGINIVCFIYNLEVFICFTAQNALYALIQNYTILTSFLKKKSKGFYIY